MNPGATTRPAASSSESPRSETAPTAVIRPAVMATSPTPASRPEPSHTSPPRITRSAMGVSCNQKRPRQPRTRRVCVSVLSLRPARATRAPRPRVLRRGGRHEGQLVPSHAVPVAARGLPRALPQRLGRRAEPALRPGARPRALQRVPRHARVRRRDGLRRHRRERAPSERLRHDAVAEPDGRRARAPHAQRDDPGARQLHRALQPADPGRRGVGDARRDLRRPADRRLSGRHVDGHQLLLRRRTRPRCATSIARRTT